MTGKKERVLNERRIIERTQAFLREKKFNAENAGYAEPEREVKHLHPMAAAQMENEFFFLSGLSVLRV
jgi:hypothetical protein